METNKPPDRDRVIQTIKTVPRISIFISSTFEDLSKTREEVSRLLGLFDPKLIIMETFGSDAAPPDINSVRQVRECDLFVGIYAHRYGTVDQTTGKSITELELDEAKRAHSSGILSDILLYFVDQDADWPGEYRQETQEAKAGLKRLKEKGRQHTYTSFKTERDLFFYIIRDVYKRLSERFGATPLKVRKSVPPPARNLSQPLGMEFIASEYRKYLVGREKQTKELLSHLSDKPIVLLLGDSGVGKTSLIHAGLIPEVVDDGWRAIYTRPFGLPYTDIVRQIQATVFEGQPMSRARLVPLLAEVVSALRGKRALLIIDQFEDVLATRDQREVEQLISELGTIRGLVTPSLRVLVSYRADLEGRLGEYWQKISGSPQGLPRVYLSGINGDEAWAGVEEVAQDLSISLQLDGPEQKRVRNDLLVESRAIGFSDVYPPYIQMLVDHIWLSSKEAGRVYRFKRYREIGAMEGVIGGYLTRQLEYAQDSKGHVRLVLVSLVRSYGVKAQRSIDEITSDTGLSMSDCEIALEKLIDLRLVRHIDTYYEISHDFIARRIASQLLDSEEREFKRFRELLTSKAATYRTTESPLMPGELLMLYKYRERVIPNELESRFLLSSWIQGTGPALYWLLNTEHAKILEWLRAEESKEDVELEHKVSIVLLRSKLGEKPLIDEDYAAFRSYQLSAEMAALILEDPLSLPRKLTVYGLRHRRQEVREACKKAVVLKIKHHCDCSWIGQLRKSSSVGLRQTYESLVLQDDLPIPKKNGDRATREFALLKKIAFARSSSEARLAFGDLKNMRPPSKSLLFGKGLSYIRTGRIKALLREAQRTSQEKAERLLAAIGVRVTSTGFETIISTYEDWNLREKGRYETPGTPSLNAKAKALAYAISRAMSSEYLPSVRQVARTIRLTPSAREIIHALLKHAGLEDFRLVLNRVAEENDRIDFWNHMELARTASRRMEKLTEQIPEFLLDIERRREFWEYIPPENRANLTEDDLLPIKDLSNRALYVRLAACMMIGAAGKEDQEYLVRLSTHEYEAIARPAAIRLVRLFGEDALRKLSSKVDDAIQNNRASSVAGALRSAEIEYFGIADLW